MSGKMFYYPMVIKEAHLDTFGHVNNATYLNLFEEARWELMTQNGYGMHKIMETGLGPTILEIKLRYLKEICLRETIIIETQLVSYRKKIAKIEQKMIRDYRLCCAAEFTCALFDTKIRKLILPTPEWLKAISNERAE